MAPRGFALSVALLATGPLAVEADANTDYPPLPGLKRVIVLARHGNRAPNQQIDMLCPNFVKDVLPGFGVAYAALSRVGMAENEENGIFIRHRYGHFLPDGPYRYDGTFAFFAERADRNVVSTQAFAGGMFPLGTGLAGFDKEKPNLIPISTTQDGADVLMNCPRDGPCQGALAADVAAWTKEHGNTVYNENKELFQNVSKACGYDMVPGQIVYEGKQKTITWAAKAVMDALIFAGNEGLDATMGGRLSPEVITQFKNKVNKIIEDTNFGKPHQITYWAGDFIPTVLKLARMPLVDEVNKFHLFLNHRELMFAVAKLLQIPIEFPDTPVDSVPAGSSLIMEVYEKGLRLFFWMPSRPPAHKKAEYLKEGKPMKELYTHGTLIPVEPKGCVLGQLCPTEQLVLSFVDYVRKTGTYVDLCNVSLEDTYFARGETSLGIMEQWVQPILDARAAGPSAASKQELSALRAVAVEALAKSRQQSEDSVGAFSVGLLSTVAAVAGYVGFVLGRRSGKDQKCHDTPYVSLS